MVARNSVPCTAVVPHFPNLHLACRVLLEKGEFAYNTISNGLLNRQKLMLIATRIVESCAAHRQLTSSPHVTTSMTHLAGPTTKAVYIPIIRTGATTSISISSAAVASFRSTTASSSTTRNAGYGCASFAQTAAEYLNVPIKVAERKIISPTVHQCNKAEKKV